MDMVVRDVPAASALALGVLCHLLTLGIELDYKIWLLLKIQAWSVLLLTLTLIQFFGYSILQSVARTACLAFLFNIGVFSSVTIYRLFFHRLRNFPGPFLARLSRFYAMYLSNKNNQYFLELHDLHTKYGDIVRVGPRQLSIVRASSLPLILGPQSTCTKGTWHGPQGSQFRSLQNTRDPDNHKQRRKTWDRAFNVKALGSYEQRVASKADLLMSQMAQQNGSPVNISQWTMFFTYDVIGSVGFNKDFQNLERGAADEAIVAIRANLKAFGILQFAPWLLHFLASIPGSGGGFRRFRFWCENRVSEIQKSWDPESVPTDVFSWILKTYTEKDESTGYWHHATPRSMREDAALVIVAGADTTSSALACAIYFLITNPDVRSKLRNILETRFPTGFNSWKYDSVKSLPYLDAVINETLRLKSPTTGSILRETPPQGLIIDDTFIPGKVNVGVPVYSIHRDERYWERPNDFLPERWLRDDGTSKPLPETFIPFSTGPYNCVGKVLAMMELRTVISKTLLRFDIAFAPGEDGVQFNNKVEDQFAAKLGPLQIIFSEREK